MSQIKTILREFDRERRTIEEERKCVMREEVTSLPEMIDKLRRQYILDYRLRLLSSLRGYGSSEWERTLERWQASARMYAKIHNADYEDKLQYSNFIALKDALRKTIQCPTTEEFCKEWIPRLRHMKSS